MLDMLKPIKTESLKEVFIARFEELILSGKLRIGQKLPSERELAIQMGVSRPVVHEGLVELSFKGLVEMRPRLGAVVTDYRKQGSLALLESLINFQGGRLDPALLDGMLDMRMLFEVETARLAAANRSNQHIEEFENLLERERAADTDNAELLAELDFEFHHLIALASGNPVYPLFLNSFKEVYTVLSTLFFGDPNNAKWARRKHELLVETLKDHNPNMAAKVMKDLLRHGAEKLNALTGNQGVNP